MSRNRGVVYTKPGEVQVQDIPDPKFEDPRGRKIDHGVILKVVSTNICGSDQHMVRGRTTAPAGMALGCRDDRVGRSGLGAVQRRLWTMPLLPGNEYRRV